MAKSTKQSRVCRKRTICEVHRQILDIVVTELQDKPKVVARLAPLIREACDMGIRLVKRLVDYKCSLPGWEKTEDIEEVRRLRKLRLELENARSKFKNS